jgi:hypothetical protein
MRMLITRTLIYWGFIPLSGGYRTLVPQARLPILSEERPVHEQMHTSILGGAAAWEDDMELQLAPTGKSCP